MPFDLDILEPSLRTIPCVSKFLNGSSKLSKPKSLSALVKNLEYNKCKIASSIPPTYWSTGSQWSTSSFANGNSEFLGVSQKKASEVPSLPDTSEFTEDKTFQLKWNNENKKFEWFEVGG